MGIIHFFSLRLSKRAVNIFKSSHAENGIEQIWVLFLQSADWIGIRIQYGFSDLMYSLQQMTKSWLHRARCYRKGINHHRSIDSRRKLWKGKVLKSSESGQSLFYLSWVCIFIMCSCLDQHNRISMHAFCTRLKPHLHRFLPTTRASVSFFAGRSVHSCFRRPPHASCL